MLRINKLGVANYILRTVMLTGLLLAFFLAVNPAPAEASKTNVPTKYKSVSADGSANPLDNEFYCEFRSSAHVYCWRSAATDLNSADGTEAEKSFWFDPERSAAVGHDVFRPDDGDSTEDYGWLHFPQSASGNYSIAIASTLPLKDSKNISEDQGVTDNDVDTSNFKTEPDSDKVCSLAMFKKGDKALTCDVGDDPIRSITTGVKYKSGFNSYTEVKKCDKGGLGFVLCPIQNMFWDAIRLLTGWMGNLLDINTSNFQNPAITAASSQLLALANSIYAIIFLVIIFANGLSIGIDNYTLKKMVPRLVAAIILSQFAFFLTGAFIDIGNVLGRGVQVFFEQLSGAANTNPGAGFAVGAGITAFIGGAAILLAMVFLIFILIAVVVALVVLMVRQAILYVLILVSPLAFAAKVLPNTEKLFKLWWDNLFKLVIMYPLFVAVISGSAFLGAIMMQSQNPLAIQVMGGLLPFVGFMLLPKVWKWSSKGILTGAISNAATKAAGGAIKKSAKDGLLAEKQGKMLMAGGAAASRIPVLGTFAGGKALKKGAAMKGAKSAADDKSWEGLGKDDLVEINRRSRGAVQKRAKKELERRTKEAADKQEERVSRGQVPSADLASKINELQVARLTGGGDRSGSYVDPETGRKTMEIKGIGSQEVATGMLIAFNKLGDPVTPGGPPTTVVPAGTTQAPTPSPVAPVNSTTINYTAPPPTPGRSNVPDFAGLSHPSK